MRFFFYGTLMDPAVLAAVVARPVPPAMRQAAAIDDYMRVYRAGALYPILKPAPGDRVEGLVVAGLTGRDQRRLIAFEGRDYAASERPVRIRCGKIVLAWVFMPRPGVPASAVPWTPEDWRRRHRRAYLDRVVSTRGPR